MPNGNHTGADQHEEEIAAGNAFGRLEAAAAGTLHLFTAQRQAHPEGLLACSRMASIQLACMSLMSIVPACQHSDVSEYELDYFFICAFSCCISAL